MNTQFFEGDNVNISLSDDPKTKKYRRVISSLNGMFATIDFVTDPNINDEVYVVDWGQQYTKYLPWIKKFAPEYLGQFAYNISGSDLFTQGARFKVLANGPHLSNDHQSLYLIQSMDTNSCFLIENFGISTINVLDNLKKGSKLRIYLTDTEFEDATVKSNNENTVTIKFDDIKVGDTVVVSNWDHSLKKSVLWIENYAPEYVQYFAYGINGKSIFLPNATFRVVAKGEFLSDKVYLLQHRSESCFLLKECGIKTVNE